MRTSTLLCLGAVLAAAASARAEPRSPAQGWVGAALLPTGRIEVVVVHELRLSTYFYLPSEAGDPWASGVDVAVGVGPRLTLGVGHSARARGTVDRGGGWCHDGPRHVCDRAYAGALADARWLAYADRRLTVAALARAGVIALGPARPVVRLGASVRSARGSWWAVVEPEVQVSLGHRELGNRDTLIAPLWLGVGRRRVAAWIQSGVRGQLVGLREKLEIPLMLGGAVTVRGVRAGVELGWPQLAGPQNTANVRHGALWLGVAF